MLKIMKPLKKIIVRYLLITGIIANLLFFWLILGLPFYFDQLLITSDEPMPADFIVCATGGLTGNNLPSEAGWDRINTAVQLYFDGYAPKIIFTGGGFRKITEAEIYKEMAQWLGCPEQDILLDPYSVRTAEHALNILKIKEADVRKDSVLNIVTSDFHSKRVELCFKKNGFKNFRVVTSYVSEKKSPEHIRILKTSQIKDYRASKMKSYGSFYHRLRWGIDHLLDNLKEVAALAWYKWKGFV
jgi:uncharacterized SAM-binding protein YcdF (DUF218 family)